MVDVVSPILKTISIFIKVGMKLYEVHSNFDSRAKSVVKWLTSLQPVIEQFEKYNDPTYIKVVNDLQTTLERGRTLMEECTTVSSVALLTKHNLTKGLREVIEDINRQLQLLDTHTRLNLREREYDLGALEKMTCEVPESLGFTVGLEKPLGELKVKLLTEGKSVTVLTGPGGFGKTTLARKLCEDKEVTGMFRSNIFFVRVPKYFDLNRMDPDERRQKEDSIISDNILEKLHHHMISNSQLPGSSNSINKGLKGLKGFLTESGKQNLLLVFDNITPKTEFLVDRFYDGSKDIEMLNYKILVTSRSKLLRFDSYYMKSLKKGDAVILLNNLLEGQCRDVSDDTKEHVLELCMGLPQAIEGVIPLLRNRPPQTWRTEQGKMQRGSVLDSVEDLLYRLQSSVDALDEKQSTVKKCFMDLCVFLKDQPIPAAALIDIWTELHNLEGEDDESIANLDQLTQNCFANLLFPRRDKTEVEEDDSYYSQHFVSQHDILRDLAIRQSNWGTETGDRLVIDVPRKSFPRWWKASMYHQPVHARLVSFSTESAIPKEWDKMNLPKAEVLVLHFQKETYALPNFLNTMSKSLKVLIVTNHGQTHAKVSSFKLLGSLSILKRLRLEGISVSSMTKNCMEVISKKFSIEVKSLLKISLFMCDFDQASSKSSIQISKSFPNLEEVNIDYCNNLKELPAELCGLKKLKKLSITNCDKLVALPEVIGELVDLQVLRLLACIKLLRLPDSFSKLSKLQLLNTTDCWSITKWPDFSGMVSLQKLIVINCPGLRKLPDSIPDRVPKIKVICDEETRKSWGDVLSAAGIEIKVMKAN